MRRFAENIYLPIPSLASMTVAASTAQSLSLKAMNHQLEKRRTRRAPRARTRLRRRIHKSAGPFSITTPGRLRQRVRPRMMSIQSLPLSGPASTLIQVAGLRPIAPVNSRLDDVIVAPTMIHVDHAPDTAQNFLGDLDVRVASQRRKRK